MNEYATEVIFGTEDQKRRIKETLKKHSIANTKLGER